LPELAEGQVFEDVAASVTEHFTSPPKPYTEDTLLSAMERAGAEYMPDDAERKGLFSPKTGKTYDGTVLLADTGGKYVNFRMEWKKQ